MEIKPKVQLKTKGETANLPTFDQAKVTLKWSSQVDLDLMVLGEDTDGGHIAVLSKLITNDAKSQGDLNAHPYMLLSEDAGVGAQGGDNSEEVKIMNLNHVKKVSIVALNFTAASANKTDASFSQENGVVTLETFKGDVATPFEVPLTSTENGTVAIIATIENTSMGFTLKMEDTVTDLAGLVAQIPAAAVLTK